jgi:hypothetical protein
MKQIKEKVTNWIINNILFIILVIPVLFIFTAIVLG